MAIFLSVRPPAWPSMGRMQYAPKRTDENRAGFWFVFIRRIKNRIGIGFIRPLPWPFVGRMQYAPTRTDENWAGFWFVFGRGRGKWPGIAWIDIPGRAFGVVRL